MHLIDMRYTLRERRINENTPAFELGSIVQSSPSNTSQCFLSLTELLPMHDFIEQIGNTPTWQELSAYQGSLSSWNVSQPSVVMNPHTRVNWDLIVYV